MFKRMSIKELEAWIHGCHLTRDYDEYYFQACNELNNRKGRAA